MKKLCCFLSIILIGSLVLSYAQFGQAQKYTAVSGIISVDTTWTKADSPYMLTGPTAVAQGVTLTIEPGVTVNLNGNYLRVNGTLTARGTSANKITFNTKNDSYLEYITFSTTSNGWNPHTGTGSIIEKANINTPVFCGSSVMIYDNYITKGIDLVGAAPVVANNTFFVNGPSDHFSDYRAILVSGESSALIVDNNISRYFENAAIEVKSGSPTIMRNIIKNTCGYETNFDWPSGILITTQDSPIVKNNTITMCSTGIYFTGTSMATIIGNNFERIYRSNVYVASSIVNPDLANNWWGTSNETEIAQKIHDTNKDFDYSTINYKPFLTEPNPQALPDPNAEPPQTILNTTDQNQAFLLVALFVVALVIVGVVLFRRRRQNSRTNSSLNAA